jgi:fermentation-respiration switch protein FrsA (DUF1100 family)
LSAAREEVRFRSDGAECAAWLYPPEAGPAPCVVLAHGFGGTREARLDAYAERFQGAGMAALVFDYRHFGASEGEPRQLISIRRQRRDWRAAIAFARGLEGVEPDRIAAWGTSYGGGHVLELAAAQPLAAAIAQTPFVDGPATVRALGAVDALRLGVAAGRDLAALLVRGEHRPVPLVGPPGSVAAMNSPDAEPGYKALYPPEQPLRNEFLPGAAGAMPFWRPGRLGARVACPLLVQVARDDAITRAPAACRAASRAPRGELLTYPGGHFDVYVGQGFERAVADQISFLRRHV